jgi:hypothetical protein
MSILTLPEFLQLFRAPKELTFREFLSTSQVRVNQHLRPLASYIKDKKIPTQDLKLLFENIQQRNDYLTRFYNLSLTVTPENLSFKSETPMKNKHFNNNQRLLSKNLIRNLHYADILQKTKSGIENNATYMDMLKDLYQKNIIDYKLLTPSARHYMHEGRLGSVFSSYYFRASIMNPFLVYSLQESLLKGTRIFTPTLGWTSYCYGFLESSQVVEYVGTDVIPSVCEKTKQFARSHSPKTLTTIFCRPSEELARSNAFRKRYMNHFDVVFFSPPYYRLELYAGEQQSTSQYSSYEEWLDKYWKATIELCHHVLQKGGKLCYILSGYGSTKGKDEYDLLGDMNHITKQYFRLHSTQPMYNKDVYVNSHEPTTEKIMLFVK